MEEALPLFVLNYDDDVEEEEEGEKKAAVTRAPNERSHQLAGRKRSLPCL